MNSKTFKVINLAPTEEEQRQAHDSAMRLIAEEMAKTMIQKEVEFIELAHHMRKINYQDWLKYVKDPYFRRRMVLYVVFKTPYRKKSVLKSIVDYVSGLIRCGKCSSF